MVVAGCCCDTPGGFQAFGIILEAGEGQTGVKQPVEVGQLRVQSSLAHCCRHAAA